MTATTATLYRATRGQVCAGWVEDRGALQACAPVLRHLLTTGGDRVERARRAGYAVEVVTADAAGRPPDTATADPRLDDVDASCAAP